MSSSAAFGKVYITLLAMKLQDAGALKSIVDCGCGEGTYHKWLAGHLAGVRWTAVEI